MGGGGGGAGGGGQRVLSFPLPIVLNFISCSPSPWLWWRGGLVVSVLDFRSEGQWF